METKVTVWPDLRKHWTHEPMRNERDQGEIKYNCLTLWKYKYN